jgi:hypothetical protein
MKSIEERVNEICKWTNAGLKEAVAEAMIQLYDDTLEECALLAEAPITGTPHTQYSEGKMDAANIIARDIRRKKIVVAEPKRRRLE